MLQRRLAQFRVMRAIKAIRVGGIKNHQGWWKFFTGVRHFGLNKTWTSSRTQHRHSQSEYRITTGNNSSIEIYHDSNPSKNRNEVRWLSTIKSYLLMMMRVVRARGAILVIQSQGLWAAMSVLSYQGYVGFRGRPTTECLAGNRRRPTRERTNAVICIGIKRGVITKT